MRAIFFILLFLNIVYLGWQFVGSSPGDEINTAPLAVKNGAARADSIVLLSEAKREKELILKAIKDRAEAEKLKAKKAVFEEAEAKKVEDTFLKDKAEKSKAGNTLATTLVDSVEVKKTSSVNVAAVKIEKEAAFIEAKMPVQPAAEQCFTVGPFRDLEKLRGLTSAIKSYVVKVDFRGKEEKAPPLYWVYTAAEKTKRLTLKTAARLRAKNINDFYIINSDRKVNSISLGRFKNKTGVQKFVKKLEKWGFDVIVELIRKDVTIYWLDYQLAAGKNIPKSIFRKFKPANKQAASRLSRQCNL